MEAYRAERHGEGVAACDRNETKRMIAVRFDVSESSMRRIKQPRLEAGLIAPKTAAVHQPKWRTSGDWLAAKITARLDISLRELQAELKQERGADICLERSATPVGHSNSCEKNVGGPRARSSRYLRAANSVTRFLRVHRSRPRRVH